MIWSNPTWVASGKHDNYTTVIVPVREALCREKWHALVPRAILYRTHSLTSKYILMHVMIGISGSSPRPLYSTRENASAESPTRRALPIRPPHSSPSSAVRAPFRPFDLLLCNQFLPLLLITGGLPFYDLASSP